MNQALSTKIPQIGDSSQQLLARMASAVAFGPERQTSYITLLASAARTTSQYINLSLPDGAIGYILRLDVTAVPGVDTVQLLNLDASMPYTFIASTPSPNTGGHIAVIRNNVGTIYNPGYVSATVQFGGVTDTPSVAVIHSGAGSFTYTLRILWLRK